MSEPSSLKVSVSIDGAEGRRSNVQRLMTAGRVIEWINRQEGLDDYTKNGLIDMVKRYPTAALPSFHRNFNQMIQRVRAKRKKERNGEVYAQDEEISKPAAAALSIDEALGGAFKPKEQGPELQVSRRPLFESEEVGKTEEEPIPAQGFDGLDPVQFEGFEPEEWEEGSPEIIPDETSQPDNDPYSE